MKLISTITAAVPLSVILCQVVAANRATLNDNTAPWPHESSTPSDCSQWIQSISTDNCISLAAAVPMQLQAFLNLNPALQLNCQGVKPGWGYCTAVSASTTNDPSSLSGSPTIMPVTGPLTGVSSNSPNPQSISTSTTISVPIPTLDPLNYPPSNGQLQCVKATRDNPNPIAIVGGAYLSQAIVMACQDIVGSSKFLAVGASYTATVVSDETGHVTEFDLTIKIGGFDVTKDICQTQLSTVMNSCQSTTLNTFGGCSYTSDYNLQACILPTDEKGTPSPIVINSPTPTSPVLPNPTTPASSFTHLPGQFPPSAGNLQCVKATLENPTPLEIWSGGGLSNAITVACQHLVGSVKFLALGDPYSIQVSDDNHLTTFLLQIKIGGFGVTDSMCETQLRVILTGCRIGSPAKSMGGCSYTSDHNLEACIFP